MRFSGHNADGSSGVIPIKRLMFRQTLARLTMMNSQFS